VCDQLKNMNLKRP